MLVVELMPKGDLKNYLKKLRYLHTLYFKRHYHHHHHHSSAILYLVALQE